MYQAKVYTVSIPSSGVALEEEYIAREVIARLSIEEVVRDVVLTTNASMRRLLNIA